jgi:hypothetical protein
MRCVTVGSCLVLLSFGCAQVTGSAIPMWEFLSRGEKVSLQFKHHEGQVKLVWVTAVT